MIPYFNSALDATVVGAVTKRCRLKGMQIDNSANGANSYVQFFDLAAASVTIGTTTPYFSMLIPQGGGYDLWIGGSQLGSDGIEFATGIAIAATTTATGSTAPGSGLVVNLFWE